MFDLINLSIFSQFDFIRKANKMKKIPLLIITILGAFYSPCDGEERGMKQVRGFEFN